MFVNVKLFELNSRFGIYTFKAKGIPKKIVGQGLVSITNKEKNFFYQKNFKLSEIAIGINLHYLMLEPGTYTFSLYLFASNLIFNGFLNRIKLWLGLNPTTKENQYKINFEVQSSDQLSKKIRNSLLKNHTELLFYGPCDSSYYPYEDQDLIPWFDRDDYMDHINNHLNNKKISKKQASMLLDFVKNGYLIIEDAYPESLISQVNDEIDDAIAKKYSGYEYGSSNRIEHLHLNYKKMNQLFLSKIQKKFVELIFNESASPCQTLIFVFGSEQDAHQDSIHLTPFPSGYMCGAWITLQDIYKTSGELVIYPGSHREKRLRMNDLGCSKVKDADWNEFGKKVVPEWGLLAKKYKPYVYKPKKGTILIWHENLLHGGSQRIDKDIERRSMVIHYFADESIGYYDSSGYPARASRI